MFRKALAASIVLTALFHQALAGQCRDVTLDGCDYSDKGPFETSKGLDESLCQQFCSDIYPGKCKFFIYDRQQKVCELFDYEQEEYASSCTKMSGPKTPDVIDFCPTDSDPCNSFIQGYCRFEGSLLDNFEDVADVKRCQLACILSTGCNYFVYDKTLRACELLATDERICDLIRGPPTPDYDGLGCEEENPTTPFSDYEVNL